MHIITVWGYDINNKVFFVTDTEREELLSVPFEKMRMARFQNEGVFDVKGNLFAPENISLNDGIPEIIKDAIIANSKALLNPKVDIGGLPALEWMKKEILDWPEIEDWQWIARFGYQVIEKDYRRGFIKFCGFQASKK